MNQQQNNQKQQNDSKALNKKLKKKQSCEEKKTYQTHSSNGETYSSTIIKVTSSQTLTKLKNEVEKKKTKKKESVTSIKEHLFNNETIKKVQTENYKVIFIEEDPEKEKHKIIKINEGKRELVEEEEDDNGSVDQYDLNPQDQTNPKLRTQSMTENNVIRQTPLREEELKIRKSEKSATVKIEKPINVQTDQTKKKKRKNK